MTRAELLRLAERVEAAQGADAELDALIYDAAGMFAWWDALDAPKRENDRAIALRNNTRASNFHPTASLDAAASLVGERMWRLGNDGKGPNPADFRAEVIGMYVTHSSVAATPALALTAAALRARAEEASDD
jgi:hypothetical protein